jgi:hypothetical protein
MIMAGPDSPFHVGYSGRVRTALKEMAQRAQTAGVRAKMLDALRAIDTRLRQDPRTFGEATYNYNHLKLVLHVAIYSPLVVQFTVHEELPQVFVRLIDTLPRQGF